MATKKRTMERVSFTTAGAYPDPGGFATGSRSSAGRPAEPR